MVLFEPARSAEPPHNSGTASANAVNTSPEAARVAFFPGTNTGSACARASGSRPSTSRSNSSPWLGFAVRQASNFGCQSAFASAARSAACLRVYFQHLWLDGEVGCRVEPELRLQGGDLVGAELGAMDEWCSALVGNGQPITVVNLMNDGLSVTAFAAWIASNRACTFSV